MKRELTNLRNEEAKRAFKGVKQCLFDFLFFAASLIKIVIFVRDYRSRINSSILDNPAPAKVKMTGVIEIGPSLMGMCLNNRVVLHTTRVIALIRR